MQLRRPRCALITDGRFSDSRKPESVPREPCLSQAHDWPVGIRRYERLGGGVAPVTDAADDTEPFTKDGHLGDLADVELGNLVLCGQARETQRVGVVFDDSPRDTLCGRDLECDGAGV
jgi:hypothetical protein